MIATDSVNWSNQFVQLSKANHDRPSFDCEEPELNNFLHTKAAKHMAVGISRTMVLPSVEVLQNGKQAICAFYSIAPSSISRQTLPEKSQKRLPHYPVPVFLLAQLAVDKQFQGKGLGKISLVKALSHFNKISEQMKAYAVVVDCLNEQAENFYYQYGFQPLDELANRKRLFLPMKTIDQLF